MKFQLLAVILCIATVFSKVEYEQGTDGTIGWSSQCQHTLQCDADIGRYIDVIVAFSNKFSTTPQVGLALKALDEQSGVPTSFDITLQNVTPEGFTYRVTAYTPKWIGTLQVNWFAILDSNIRIQYMNQQQTPSLADQSVSRAQNGLYEIVYVNYDRPLECEYPTASVFLLGGEAVAGANELVVYSIDVSDPGYMEVAVETGTGYVNWISFMVVAGCENKQESFYLGSQQAEQAMNWTVGSGKRMQNFSQEVDRPEFMQSGFEFNGISGFDLPDSGHNLRLNIESTSFEGDTYSANMGTWAGTVLNGLFIDVFTYQPQNQCAVLYSECNYQGDSISVCSGEPVNSMAIQQWGTRNVKSVQVPYGRKLTLFDADNMEGPYTQVQGEVACANGWTFT